jgi:hypothetical protein
MNSEKKNQTIYTVLAVLILLTLLNSGYFFVGILKLGIGRWLAFNACSLASIAYLVCFIAFRVTKKHYLLAVPLLPLYYYGTMGLFVMPWNESGIIAQITHIVITINVLWVIYGFLKEQKFESLGKGLLIGVIVFVPVFAYLQTYVQLHNNEFIQALQKM